MFAMLSSQLRRDRGGQLRRGLGGALSGAGTQQQQQQPNQQQRFFTSSSARSAAGGGSEDRREGSGQLHYMTSEHSTASAWEAHQPKLGTWPNAEPGVPRPDVVQPPEPSIFVKERKMPIIGGVSDADVIAEYDRIRGTADLNDNSSWTSGM
ncbi:hypothetical protein PLESTB_000443400 [Pleodorina starrii]|uniref:Uncharacterized protein n=1 Tax=Pleodorina starrii TaxID=330485 RepID=A0A9W6BFP0_9CHLO|nr:hypothetical protein PLESTB_000443400 [Pleodorina starrii]